MLFDEPGVKAVEFTHRAHALAHFLRATTGAGALLALLGRRAPEIRHLRRWLSPIMQGARSSASARGRLVRRERGGMSVRRAGSGADLSLHRSGSRVVMAKRTPKGSCGYTSPHRVDGGGRRRLQRWLGIHNVPTATQRNPNKIRHLRDLLAGAYLSVHAPGWTRAGTPRHSGGRQAGSSGISGESADATKGSGTRRSW